MTQEEKAKRYDEALTKARNIVNSINVGLVGKDSFESVFPELKESEDEKIRKAVIDAVETLSDSPLKVKMLAWLEKQGEQKPVPKFKIGDTMRTLQEAKDVFTDGMPVVVSIDEEYYHCTNEKIAIKDQDDYEYPPMNRRQKTIGWSEEDEKRLSDIIVFVSGYATKEVNKEWVDFLKSLKDRVQPKQEWSEKDEKIKEGLINSLAIISANTRTDSTSINYTFSREIDWLKSLRPQSKWKPSEEQIDAIRYVANFDYGGYKSVLVSLYEQLKAL